MTATAPNAATLRVSETEHRAHDKLRQGWLDGHVVVHVDFNHLNRGNSPVHNFADNMAPLAVMVIGSLMLLVSVGMAAGAVALVLTCLIYIFLVRPWAARRLRLRVEAMVMDTPEGLKQLWALGGLALGLRTRPKVGVTAPKGSWSRWAEENVPEKYVPAFTGVPEHTNASAPAFDGAEVFPPGRQDIHP